MSVKCASALAMFHLDDPSQNPRKELSSGAQAFSVCARHGLNMRTEPTERPPYPAIAVANFFIEHARWLGEMLSPMKVQKLVFFAHGWHLAITSEPLIDEQVEAWRYGPVVPSVYHAFKQYGNGAILELAHENYFRTPTSFFNPNPPVARIPDTDSRTRGILHKVWDVYGKFTAIELSNMTHLPDTPWAMTWRDGIQKGTDIASAHIRDYFIKLGRVR